MIDVLLAWPIKACVAFCLLGLTAIVIAVSAWLIRELFREF